MRPSHSSLQLTVMLAIAATGMLCGCKSDQPIGDLQQKLQSQLQAIVIENGISRHEANIIAESYFVRFGPGNGAVKDVVEKDGLWVAETYVGYSALPGEPIRINQHTGKVTCANGPSFENPKAIFN